MFLKDTSAADLNAIVEFMYKGSVNVSQAQLASFIKTAEMLQVRGLSGDDEKVRLATERKFCGTHAAGARLELVYFQLAYAPKDEYAHHLKSSR